MKRVINRTMIITSITCLIPFLISAIFYKSLPDQVATHFDFNGVPDGYSSKLFAAFGLPALMFIINIILNFFLDSDPKKSNVSKTINTASRWIIPILAVIMQSLTVAYAVGKNINISVVVSIFVGILIMILGNYLPKCKQNYTVGVKTPWTLNNEEVWNKTHKIAGYLWVIGGFIITISSLVGIKNITLWVFVIIGFVPIIYSYVLYKKIAK